MAGVSAALPQNACKNRDADKQSIIKPWYALLTYFVINYSWDYIKACHREVLPAGIFLCDNRLIDVISGFNYQQLYLWFFYSNDFIIGEAPAFVSLSAKS